MPTGVYPRQPTAARFWAKVDKNGPVPDYAPHLGRCWLWTAGRFTDGYGKFSVAGKATKAHRWAYEQECGPIPEGFEPDHLCRVRHCVRPSHIEPVTHRENLMRGDTYAAQEAKRTHCPHGHPYDDENTYLAPRGDRECRECRRGHQRRRRKTLD